MCLVLNELCMHIQQQEVLKTDLTECAEIVRLAYANERMKDREEFLATGHKIMSLYKNEKFYSRAFTENLLVL